MTAPLLVMPEMLEDDIENLLRPPDDDNPDRLGFLPLHLGRVEQATGRAPESLELPDSWNTVSALDDWPVDRLPAVVIVAQGTDQDPIRNGDGTFSAWYGITLAFVVSSAEYWYARRLAGAYAMAGVEALLWHLQRESPRISDVKWGGITPGKLPVRNRQRTDTVAAGQTAFLVLVENIINDVALIREAPEDPYVPIADALLVETADVAVVPIP